MKILVVEDNVQLNKTVCTELDHSGFMTDACYDGEDAVYYAETYDYSLIILDRMLPKLDGLKVLKKIRENKNTPVIFVTALNGVNDRIDGLDMGADDYLAKPFSMAELLARVRALLRRPGTLIKSDTIDCGGIEFVPDELILHGKTGDVGLSSKESALLKYFLKNEGQTLKREQIICHIWGDDTNIEDGNLDNYIFFLRRRLKASSSRATIRTVYGTGYRLEITTDGQ